MNDPVTAEQEQGTSLSAPTAEKKAEQTKRKFFSASNIAKIGVFAALTTVLYYFPKFPIVALFPSFLELNFSDIPALIGTFSLGPVAGALIVLVKCLLKLPATSTMCVGELSDLVCGLAFVIPAGLIYRRHRTFRGALAGLGIGTLSSVIFSMLSNRFVIVPAYVSLMGIPMEGIVAMLTPLFPSCTAENLYSYYIPFSVLPFNLLRCLIASAVTLLLYKRISRLLNKF